MQRQVPKPILKWAGGKTQLLGDISHAYPPGFGNTIRRYAEPFVGGGAVLFDILSKYELDEVYISDVNAELINMYFDGSRSARVPHCNAGYIPKGILVS